MNEILISGHTGFVGANLANYLQQKNYSCLGLSRNSAAVTKSVHEVFEWHELNKINNKTFTAFIHLAGKAHDTTNTANETEYFTINTKLTIKLFDLFLQGLSRDFIYFSSVKAVADTVQGVLTEEYSDNPLTAYGKSKLEAEKYLLSKSLPSGKRLFIIRPCMIHGPGNKGNLNLLYQFVKKGIPYPLAAFENKRSFLSIDNLCFIIEKILENTVIPSSIYNVADDEFLSTNKVVEIISTTLNKKIKVLKVPKSIIQQIAYVGDKLNLPFNSERLKKLTEDYVVCNNKIKSYLNIDSLPLTAEQGLEKTIQSFSVV